MRSKPSAADVIKALEGRGGVSSGEPDPDPCVGVDFGSELPTLLEAARTEAELLKVADAIGYTQPSPPPEELPRAHVQVVGAPIEPDPDFYLRPDWYADLKMLVDRGGSVLLIGPAGCISWDTHVGYVVRDQSGMLVNKKGGTLERLYQRFNNVEQPGAGPRWRKDVDFFVQSVADDGVVRLNRIAAVVDSGQKEVFRVTTQSGKCLKATADHEFMVADGYKPLSQLGVGDRVCVNTGRPQSQGGRRPPPYRKEVLVKYHPTATTKIVNGCVYHRIKVYRAAFEARRNGFAYGDYIALLNSGDVKAIDALWIIPEGYDVHHRDEDMENNAIENLQLVDHTAHGSFHGGRGPLIYVELDPIAVIERVGIEQVYDIACGTPYHNFVAGGVVVHNCGKSEAVEQVFAERGQQLLIVSCTPRLNANDLEGAVDLVVSPEGIQVTAFTPANTAIASREGYGLLLDEADAAPPEAMYSIYRLLDGKPMRIVRAGAQGNIPLHPEFRAVGTQNTEGRGDERGLHHGRALQDEAFLDRWDDTIRVNYLPMHQEVMVLRKRNGLSGPPAEKIVKSAIALRNALQQEEILYVCTTRRTLAVAKNVAGGMSPKRAWEFAVLNRATPEDASNMLEPLQRIYGDTWGQES